MVDSVFLFIFVFVFVFVAQMCVWCMCGAVQCSAVGAGGGLGVAEVMRLAICRVGDKMANVLVSRTCGFIAWAVVASMVRVGFPAFDVLGIFSLSECWSPISLLSLIFARFFFW